MLLRHTTTVRRWASIERNGLLCKKSRGTKKVIWLHSASNSWWAIAHTQSRHGVGQPESTITFEVRVPRSWIKRFSRKGLWYCKKDISVERFGRLLTLAQLEGS